MATVLLKGPLLPEFFSSEAPQPSVLDCVEVCPPLSYMLKSCHPITQNMSLLGNRDIVDVISSDEGHMSLNSTFI